MKFKFLLFLFGILLFLPALSRAQGTNPLSAPVQCQPNNTGTWYLCYFGTAPLPLTPSKPSATALYFGPFNQPVSLGNPLPVAVTNLGNPCVNNVPGDAAVSQTATAKIVSGKAGFRILVCHERISVSAAEVTSELEGTGTTCGTGKIVHSGSSTAASGEQLGAAGAGYETSVPFYLLPGNDYCIQQNGTSIVAGKVSYLYVQ